MSDINSCTLKLDSCLRPESDLLLSESDEFNMYLLLGSFEINI